MGFLLDALFGCFQGFHKGFADAFAEGGEVCVLCFFEIVGFEFFGADGVRSGRAFATARGAGLLVGLVFVLRVGRGGSL